MGNAHFRAEFLLARKCLVGESTVLGRPEESGVWRHCGARIKKTYILANRTEARTSTESADLTVLPTDWSFQDYPDGRGGIERCTLFGITPSCGDLLNIYRTIEFYEDLETYHRENHAPTFLRRGQGAECYSRLLLTQPRIPGGNAKVKSLDEAREQIRTIRAARAARSRSDQDSQAEEQLAQPQDESQEEEEPTDSVLAAALALQGPGAFAERKGKGKGKGKSKGKTKAKTASIALKTSAFNRSNII